MDSINVENKISLLKNPIGECDKMIEENSVQFEHKITYIGAGAIGVVFLFAKEYESYSWLFIAGVFVLLFACMMNLYSYIWYINILRKDANLFYDLLSELRKMEKNPQEKTIAYEELIQGSDEEFRKYIAGKIDQRCQNADRYNKINLWILFMGFFIIIVYVSLNIMS